MSCLLAVSTNPRNFLPSGLLQNTAPPPRAVPSPPVGQVVRMNECPRLTAEARLSLLRWRGNAAGPRELRCRARGDRELWPRGGGEEAENVPSPTGGEVRSSFSCCLRHCSEAPAAPTLSAGVSPGQRLGLEGWDAGWRGRALSSQGAAMAPLRGWAARDRPGPAAFPAPRRAPPRPPRRGDPAAAPGPCLASGARSDDHGRWPRSPARGVSGRGSLGARAVRGGCSGTSQEEPQDRTAAPAAGQPAPGCLPGTLAQSLSLWVPTFSPSLWSVHPWGGPCYDQPSLQMRKLRHSS